MLQIVYTRRMKKAQPFSFAHHLHVKPLTNSLSLAIIKLPTEVKL